MSKNNNNERLSGGVLESRPNFFFVAGKDTSSVNPRQSTTSLPYAQLCLNSETNTLITVIESGDETKSKWLRVIGHLDDMKATDCSLPSITSITSGISSLSNLSFETKELWEEEEETGVKGKSRCGESLRKLLFKSHSSIFAFGARHKMLFANIEYTSLD